MAKSSTGMNLKEGPRGSIVKFATSSTNGGTSAGMNLHGSATSASASLQAPIAIDNFFKNISPVGKFDRWISGILQKTVLQPHYYLRRQLYFSFGITACLGISFFVGIGILTATLSGLTVIHEARQVQEDLARHTLGTSARYTAETITKKFNNYVTASALLRQATMDRIVGYKHESNTFLSPETTDRWIPFLDSDTGAPIYPLDTPELLRLDWNVSTNIHTAQDAQEHLQGRKSWFPEKLQVSTAYAAYFMQGACDPTALEQDDPAFYPNCTHANNNLETGGVVSPSPTNRFLANKAKDLVFLLKGLYESHVKVKQLGVYFANSGAGSYVKFPAHIRDGAGTYTTIGCDWLRRTINPYTRKFMGTAEEAARCHPYSRTNSTQNIVPLREYNALERPWCVRQAKSRDGTPVSTGPYKDASSSADATIWVLTFGHGVFDRLTQEFIGCTLIDVTLADLRDVLDSVQVGVTSSVALVRWQRQDEIQGDTAREGMVIACANCQVDPLQQTELLHVTNPKLGLGVDEVLFAQMQSLVDYNQVWDPDDVRRRYNQTVYTNDGRLIMMSPIPYLPSEYDPFYRPEYMIVMTISEAEIYGDSNRMEAVIRGDIRTVIRDICLIGVSGLVLIFGFLTWISRTLSKPLTWMQETTARVITNAGGDDLAAGTGNNTTAHMAQCSPRTEVTVLLSEFEMMMDGFSGTGAAEVADARINEVENKFVWREAYQVLYPYNFRKNEIESDDDSVQERNRIADTVSVTTQVTLLSALTENSLVQSYITQPYSELAQNLTKSVSSIANASYTAGMERLPEWAQKLLNAGTVESDDLPDYIVSPPKVNQGRNMKNTETGSVDHNKPIEVSSSSRLFWWVTLCIGVPILGTATAVVWMGQEWIRSNLGDWLEDVKASSYDLEQDAIVTATLSRSAYGEEVMFRFTRDLHIYARTAGWLLFGALTRSKGFTTLRTGAEECKVYEKGTCPFQDNRVPCDCAWNDPYATEGQCTNYSASPLAYLGSRPYQTSWFEGQRTDIDPETGARVSAASYNKTSATPDGTAWWSDPSELPGAEKGSSAAGYATTYDRVRVLSAMAAIQFPLYNYYPGRDEERHLGSFIGLDADGMMFGYVGCGKGHSEYAHFQSKISNGAANVAPKLCPKGKFGYDCRCRGWYERAREEEVYISSPYVFAAGAIGTSAASTIRDPVTSELIAEALLDFLPTALAKALGPGSTVIGPGDQGFPIVITPSKNIFGGNTIIGPGYEIDDGSTSILDLIVPEDSNSTRNYQEFSKIVKKMDQGDSGNVTFVRTQDGDPQSVFMAYAPVNVRVLRPVDHRDFAAGSNASSKLVYGLAIGIVESDLFLRYEAVEERVDQQVFMSTAVSVFSMVIIATLFTVLTYYISLNIIRPIIALTKIVKSIKNKSLREEIPDVQGGSREVSFVHESFQRLMKVVRFANTAFFAGDRTQSFHSMEDALNLFVKLGNQKAIGVANNNLGTMVLQEQMESFGTDRHFDNSMFGICISEIYNVGINYFDESIKNGSFEYELARDTEDMGPYAKQLANRHFNRGMFLVVVRHHPLCPSWINEDGVSDILRAKDLDLEVMKFLHLNHLEKAYEVQEFESLLRRARGILLLVRNYGFADPWGIDTLIEMADTMLSEAVFTSNLFNAMGRVGRRQQIDDLRIQHELCKKDYLAAGKIAMRMLVEDEYIIDTVIVNASTAVNRYFQSEGIRIPTINATQYLQRETRKAQVNVMREAKNVFFCLDYSGSMAGERMARANKNLLWVYHEHCSDKDMVGFIRFNHDIDDSLWFPLGKKGDWGQVQEAVLMQATGAEGGTRFYAALNRCVTQILNTETKNDTWIIALTDGESSWDHPAKKVVERISNSNKKRSAKIHVIIIGFEVPVSVVKTCKGVTAVTDKSLYIDARGGLEEMDKAFEQVVSVIGGSAITMESF
ncbi:expressed unknown protein [Seminavis robusta]|uniref:VWFA domain-containing protein n=1 Tax=Seminavis robusta TaxID=568900 RepID=A0A9N8DPM7_9STRA|nr:expressed unknown protein [Seminavis robusta]|eukprot:Sro257_g100860.1 n/a (1931) ;mRNA; r:36587-43642